MCHVWQPTAVWFEKCTHGGAGHRIPVFQFQFKRCEIQNNQNIRGKKEQDAFGSIWRFIVYLWNENVWLCVQ